MKKLGLRAVAGGLAVLMAVAGFAPASASAADMLITAKAPKTLVITADMVDDDGEIVISGEKWDRIIVEKEAAAKDIYFDGVEVGELVVESGRESNIQLWEVAAQQVTVKEPELVELDINEIRTLYADKETKAQAFDLYLKSREDNKKTLTKAPSIVTMEDAVVESLTVSGSVELNVAQGAVKAVSLEANAKVSQMNVTLNGYEGDVAYKGTEGFSVINLNSVNCAIENLKVEGSATNNYLNVESKNSATVNVEVAGNAGVSLNIPVAKLDVVEGATAAQVSVLSTVDELNVAASNASVNVGADAKVAAATIVGDKVSMSGEGKLTKVEITGKDASVSTSGTGIKGENTYRPPAEKKPQVVLPGLPANSIVYNFADLNTLIVNQATIIEVDGGGQKISTSDLYGQVHYTLPTPINLGDYEKIIITMSDTTGGVGITPRTAGGWGGTSTSFWWGRQASEVMNVELRFDQMGYGWNSTITADDLTKEITEICLQSCGAPTDFTVYRIALIPKEGVTPPAGDDAPNAGDDTPDAGDDTVWGESANALDLAARKSYAGNGLGVYNEKNNTVTYTDGEVEKCLYPLNATIASGETTNLKVTVKFADAASNGVRFWFTDDAGNTASDQYAFANSGTSATATEFTLTPTADVTMLMLASAGWGQKLPTVTICEIIVGAEEEDSVAVEPLTIKAGDCWYWSINGVEGVKGDENPAAADGSVSWPITGAYREFRLLLPTEDGYDLSQYTKVVVDFTTDNPIFVRLWPIADQQKNAYGYPAPIYEKEASGTVEFDLTADPLYQAAYASDSYTDFDLKEFGFTLNADGVTANVKINSITLK